MPATVKTCTMGDFMVKQGMDNTFLTVFENIVHESLKHYKIIGDVKLFQDPENPQHYVSYSEWYSVDDVKAWMREPYYRNYVRRLEDICDSYERHYYTLRLDIPYAAGVKEEARSRTK